MTLRGILQVVSVLGTAASLWWLVDSIGDRREARVRADLEPQVARAEMERDRWKAAHDKLLQDARSADNDNRDKLRQALEEKRRAADLALGRGDGGVREAGAAK